MQFTNKLRQARQLRGLSAEEVAKQIGVDRRSVYRMEKNLPEVVKKTLCIVKLYGLTPNDVFLDKSVTKNAQ